MNSNKFIVLLLFLFILAGCGVKSDPVKYSETAIDSYVQSYTGLEPTPEEAERIKRSKESTEASKKQDAETKTPTLIPAP